MISVVFLAAFVLVLALLTHDRDGLNFGARDLHRAQHDRDARTGRAGRLVA